MTVSRGGPRAPVLIAACERCGEDFTYQVRGCRRRKRCETCEKARTAQRDRDWRERTGWMRPSRAKEISP